MSENSNFSLFIPGGFAHGFFCRSNECMIYYKCSNYRHKSSEKTLQWNDKKLKIKLLKSLPNRLWGIHGMRTRQETTPRHPGCRDVVPRRIRMPWMSQWRLGSDLTTSIFQWKSWFPVNSWKSMILEFRGLSSWSAAGRWREARGTRDWPRGGRIGVRGRRRSLIVQKSI